MDRRRFLRYAVTLPLATVIACRTSGRNKQKSSAKGAQAKPASQQRECHIQPKLSGPGQVLKPLEWATMAAVCARILPKDEDPGANEAGVVGYIDRQFRHRVMSKHHPLLRRGVQLLQLAARKRHNKLFTGLAADEQDALIGELQTGKVGGRFGSAAFTLMHRLTLEGFFCDPIYGGNKDAVGWKMIGFAPQSPRPRCPYEGRI
jgi:gluconate 2-dehydrogenase gamma chain